MADEPHETRTLDLTPASDDLKGRYKMLTGQNERKYQMLQEKHQVVITDLEAKYFRQLLDYLLPPGSTERVKFEIEWQEFIAAQLELIHAKVVEDKKAKPLVAEKRLILPDGPL
jgi:hypothetical protein